MKQIVSKRTIVLAVCALCLCLGTGADKQVTRPYKIKGVTTGEITSFSPETMTITFRARNTGEATHCGAYSNTLTGSLSLATLQGSSQGLFVCANGDQIGWTATISGATLTVTATSGTGRFEGGSGGGFVAELDNIVVDLDEMTISYTFEGRGTVTY